MKLNLRPNNDREVCKLLYQQQLGYNLVIYLSLLVYNSFIHHIILVTCSENPLLVSQATAATNHQQAIKHSTTSQSNTTLPEKDVANLHLISDFRSVKLRWSYEHSDKNQPASFDVRFCELTSWNMEIKCRQRNMMVEHGADSSTSYNDRQTIRLQQNKQATGGGGGDFLEAADQANSVILAPSVDTVHQLRGTPTTTPNGPAQMYEAQIYDLRALTNYTFQVKVSRFEHEPPKSPLATIINSLDGNNTTTTNRPINLRAHSARRLTSGGHNELSSSSANELQQHLVKRIETKPFGAEATKCLADVSEVLINTGRYFGGRISVEDSNDPRCHLIGNKSSEQSTYLFKIDHNVCASKIVDGKRIETMVLVHENKDILTHNTARFLVLCNFLQKSFTLRASVSLPKVNALLAPPPASRPAVITSLPRYKLATLGVGNTDELQAKKATATSNVMLGSMPGIYRARVPHANTVETSNDQTLKRAATNPSSSSSFDQSEAADVEDANRVATSHKPAVNNSQPLDELESNTIERKFVGKASGQRLLAAEGQAAAISSGQPALAIQLRQPKELGFAATPPPTTATATESNPPASARRINSNGIDGSPTRSMVQLQLLEPDQVDSLQAARSSNKFLAKPVQVQSKVLYIEREDASPATRVTRLHQHYLNPQQQPTTTNSAEHSSQIDTPEPRMPTTSALAQMVASPPPPPPPSSSSSSFSYPPSSPVTAPDKTTTDFSRQSKQLAEAKLSSGRSKVEELTDLQTPIIITNNHRISGDHLPVARQAATSSSSSFRVSKWLNSPGNNGDGGNNFTIKYSADRVDDFPVGNQDDNFAGVASDGAPHKIMGPPPANLMMRARSGRMRSMASGVNGDLGQTPLAVATTSTTMAPLSVADLNQPAWSVQRMGETFGSDGGGGGGGDLMDSETSNETASQMMVTTTASNSSLAQNITGAILRWSLKTLTNLARKSLESLINDTTTSTVPSSYFSAELQNEFDNQASPNLEQPQPFEQPDPLASGANRWLSNRPEPATRRPFNHTRVTHPASVQQHHHTIQPSTPHATTAATTRRSGSSPLQVVPATNFENGLRPLEERLMANDGFIISERQRDSTAATTMRQQPLAGTTTTSTPPHNSSRPSNFSKSLDLSRVGDPIRSRNTSDRINSGPAGSPIRPINQGNLKHHHQLANNEINNNHSNNNESLWSQRASALYTSWLFYGILLFVALITAIVMIVCLVSTTPRRSHSRSALDSGAHGDGTRSIRPLGFRRESALPGLVFGEMDGGHPGSCQSSRDDSSSHDITYQKYDYNKFENYSSDSINNRLAGGLPVQDRHTAMDTTTASCGSRFSQQSPSEVSHSTTTRSMSANSSSAMIPDENNCKNNKFLYTAEHVLINTGASFGESYA